MAKIPAVILPMKHRDENASRVLAAIDTLLEVIDSELEMCRALPTRPGSAPRS